MRKRHLVFSVTMAILLLLAMMMGSLPVPMPAVAQGAMGTPSAPPHTTAVPPDVPLSSLNASPATEAATSLRQITPGDGNIPGFFFVYPKSQIMLLAASEKLRILHQMWQNAPAH